MKDTPEIKEYPWPERWDNPLARPKSIRYIIDENGCWICVSHSLSGGYPQMKVGKRHSHMHHYIWEREHGRKVGKGLVVRHLCNNRLCINPAHLKEGTQKENVADAIRARTHSVKTQFQRGEAHHNSKLTNSQILAIYTSPLVHSRLAEQYGVYPNTISRIKSGKRWGWLTGVLP